MTTRSEDDLFHSEILHKKSVPLGSSILSQIPTTLMAQSREWWFSCLTESDKIQLVSNYLATMALILEGSSPGETYEH